MTDRPSPPDAPTEWVLDAARQVLAARGFNADLAEIATRAGVGVASIYRRWPSKEALIRAVMQGMIDDAKRRLTRIAAELDDAREAIRASNDVGFLEVRNYGELATATVAGLMPSAYRDMYPFEELDAYFGHLIRKGIEQGHFRPDLDVPHAVKAWKALVAPEPIRQLASDRPIEELSRLTSEFLLAALSRPPKDEP